MRYIIAFILVLCLSTSVYAENREVIISSVNPQKSGNTKWYEACIDNSLYTVTPFNNKLQTGKAAFVDRRIGRGAKSYVITSLKQNKVYYSFTASGRAC